MTGRVERKWKAGFMFSCHPREAVYQQLVDIVGLGDTVRCAGSNAGTGQSSEIVSIMLGASTRESGNVAAMPCRSRHSRSACFQKICPM